MTIDKGSSAGLRKDMAVIAPAGVVGRIVDPPPLYAAKVQLLIDREAGAGAIIERSGAGGVVVGQDRDGEPPLQLEFVSNLADVKVGDRVVTSGIDGIFPRGFPIGTLAKVEQGIGSLQADCGDAGGRFLGARRGAGRPRAAADDRPVAGEQAADHRRAGNPPGRPGGAAGADPSGEHRPGADARRTPVRAAGGFRRHGRLPGPRPRPRRRLRPARPRRPRRRRPQPSRRPRPRPPPNRPGDDDERGHGRAADHRRARAADRRRSSAGRRGIDLVLVVVVWAALQFGPGRRAADRDAAAGLAQDALSGGIIGVGGFAKTLVGFGAGVFGSQFIVTNALHAVRRAVRRRRRQRVLFLGLYAVIERRGFDMPWRQAGTRR